MYCQSDCKHLFEKNTSKSVSQKSRNNRFPSDKVVLCLYTSTDIEWYSKKNSRVKNYGKPIMKAVDRKIYLYTLMVVNENKKFESSAFCT